MEWKQHGYRVGSHSEWFDNIPTEENLLAFETKARKHIEPWLSAVFQADHLNLLVGSGFTTAICDVAGANATGMGSVSFNSEFDVKIDAHAKISAERMMRGTANIEDQFRSALALLEGLTVLSDARTNALKTCIDTQLLVFLQSLLRAERGIISAADKAKRAKAEGYLQSFLLSFASRAASRERLHVFTSNYDRLLEHACDLAGLRIMDRFVGALNPVFRSSRVDVDVHYNPPGIRGEPRFMEGVVRLTKLHGSLDWRYESETRQIVRRGIPFGAPDNHTDIPQAPTDSVMIYPNAAKDVETTEYPYAELFRDFAAALCRPNSVLVTYGYGFGDDHINRVLKDMLAIPSSHLTIICYKADERIKSFCETVGRDAQISLLMGSHFSSLEKLVEHYLPKPALDYITSRQTELLKHRPDGREPVTE